MSNEIKSHNTIVFATNRHNEIIFFKSYLYFEEQDEAKNDLDYAEELAHKEGGAWYISALDINSRWNLTDDNEDENYRFKTPSPIK